MTAWYFTDHPLRVAGRDVLVTGSYDPGVPGNRRGHPDNWTPPEEAVVEIEQWRYADAGGDPVSDAEVDAAAFHQLPAYYRALPGWRRRVTTYDAFLDAKRQESQMHGFEPVWMPSFLMDFQQAIVDWATRKGRCAIFADCGLGKTPMQLVWAENVVRKTGGRVLILTPLAVGAQTKREGDKFNIEVHRSREGELPGQIIVTNYERLHHFRAEDFSGCVCDESSILKSYDGKYKAEITEFMRRMSYRLLCTATAAPNDYVELGTSCEALGIMRRMEMLGMYFIHDGGDTQRWRVKGHAGLPFWRWVCSWARALRKPSDLGFDDGPFLLPEMFERDHVIKPATPRDGLLFDLPAVGLNEQREERRRTLHERCELAAELASKHDASILWCYLNPEGDLLERLVPGCAQVSGSQSDDEKEEKLLAFLSGQARVLVTKPMCAGFGLNMQHCAHMTFFPSHSYEQYYQSVRRFGQTRPVTVDIVTSEGECMVMQNIQRKAAQADRMFTQLIGCMHDAEAARPRETHTTQIEVPAWLSANR